ncbi:uncharacterized protein LOC119268002 isoform X2 [Triticum dicoccoides]|uniref:uncharacterized protein LOC119268002 isoform X2 n=1 Tax=Triticum dicoccoides TaxID=85692 RepID=UPI00188FB58A|nr:uncharacterized protein LOC119268002 isoform X2 [Triticum dicoccoides]XP_037405376.1 uncharacterized protein LOC119268002 isoform X2 [Triticum dicoccoides]XP_037405377.1 uncharacterized protein LOC119268002 isoform X2 [Triticum dicoccoides]
MQRPYATPRAFRLTSPAPTTRHCLEPGPLSRHARTGTSLTVPKDSVVNRPSPMVAVAKKTTPPRQMTAVDYSNYITNRYPTMSSQTIAVLLREQNARAVRHLTTASGCTCCTARGFSDCPVRPQTLDEESASCREKRKFALPGATHSAQASYHTPKYRKLSGLKLDLSDCEVESPPQRSGVRKGSMQTEPTRKPGHHVATSSHNKDKHHGRSDAICNAIQQYAICIAEAVKDIYVDSIQENQTGVFFSISTAELPKRKYVSSRSYAGNPWFKGRPVVPPKTDIADLLEAYLPSLPDNQLAQNWIVHGTPREIRIRVVEIQLQIISNSMLNHELGSILIHQLMQMDSEANLDTPCLTHRHILECDFSIRMHHASNVFGSFLISPRSPFCFATCINHNGLLNCFNCSFFADLSPCRKFKYF